MSNTSYEMSTTKTPGTYLISGLGTIEGMRGGEGDKPNLMAMADGIFRHAFHDLAGLKGPFTLSSLTTDFPQTYRGGEIKITITVTRKTRNLVFAGLEARVGKNIIMTASGLWSY